MREEKDSGQNLAYAVLRHLCGLYVYAYNDSVLFKEPGSRTGVADMVLWSNWGMTLQMHAYFIENIVLFIPFGLLFPLGFFKKLDEMVYNTCWCFYKRSN